MSITDKIDKLTPFMVRSWLVDRIQNCARIAALKTGLDRDGWLEDAAYFSAAVGMIDWTSIEAGDPAPSVDSGNVQGWRTDFANAPTDGSDVLFQFLNHYDVPSGPLTSNIVCQWDALENGGWLNSDTLDFIEDIPVRFMLIPGDPGYRSGGDAEAEAGDEK